MELFSAVWLCLYLVLAVQGNTEYHANPLIVSAPYVSYVCPEGANVTLVCEQSGSLDHLKDRMHHAWLFTQHMDQRCQGPLHHSNSVLHRSQARSFSITLLEVTQANQGRYCCLALDVLPENKHKPHVLQEAHSYMMLTITPRSVTASVAVAIVIMCLLCLPVLLVLVYRQRQRPHGSRRAHELVRMDSEAQGHENPMYTGGSPKTPSRTVAQILTRQTSESGRHLLSDPGTPFSQNPQGDVFFPAHEPIPESPDFQPL
ncbi:hypothetical protein QTP70_015292 [Hemibagrus guttatus]|uniref:Ig-like domain-containing protein n=1 Tax=Hemibagrus guttatus TaxID=175788 RepID=A0AAE0VBB5_9TELE|nr:hypothetical protein QTP70_015292 [Hemibagrus guttatus]